MARYFIAVLIVGSSLFASKYPEVEDILNNYQEIMVELGDEEFSKLVVQVGWELDTNAVPFLVERQYQDRLSRFIGLTFLLSAVRQARGSMGSEIIDFCFETFVLDSTSKEMTSFLVDMIGHQEGVSQIACGYLKDISIAPEIRKDLALMWVESGGADCILCVLDQYDLKPYLTDLFSKAHAFDILDADRLDSYSDPNLKSQAAAARRHLENENYGPFYPLIESSCPGDMCRLRLVNETKFNIFFEFIDSEDEKYYRFRAPANDTIDHNFTQGTYYFKVISTDPDMVAIEGFFRFKPGQTFECSLEYGGETPR